MNRKLLPLIISLSYLISLPSASIEIDSSGNVSGSFGSVDEESRFFPGVYFFRKGCRAYADGNWSDAIDLWTQSASWGHKGAQYNLGIAYLKGKGVSANVPLGLAWLGLSAQGDDAQFQDSFDAAWYASVVEDRIEAKQRYEVLKPIYGDDVAFKRALRRYSDELRNLTGSRVGGSGNLTIYSRDSPRGISVAKYRVELELKANEYFGRDAGSVSVGELIPLVDETESPRPADQ